MCPVDMSMFDSAGSSLHDDVDERDEGGRSFSFDNEATRAVDVSFLPAIRALHSSW